MDNTALNRELDKVKSEVFIGKNTAFLGSIMCAQEIIWDSSIPTAQTNGEKLWWNPEWFLSLPPETRKTILVHELWHPARLHGLRQGTRNPEIWNYACDIRINNGLEREGYSFRGVEDCWKDQQYGDMPEEDIYDDLIARGIMPPPSRWSGRHGKGDLEPNPNATPMQQIGTVVRAMQQARILGEAASIPGDLEKIVDTFLAPVVPWEVVLHRFFNDLLDETYSWRQPNRRYQHIYLPSPIPDTGRLDHLTYYLDVSGSITDADVIRFNSEVKYCKEQYNPKKLTLVQFDTKITQETVFLEDDPFEKIVVVGRGGTSLVPVREHILEHKPTAAIIFSDLKVEPMEPLDQPLPVIWVAVDNRGATVPFGQLIHIK